MSRPSQTVLDENVSGYSFPSSRVLVPMPITVAMRGIIATTSRVSATSREPTVSQMTGNICRANIMKIALPSLAFGIIFSSSQTLAGPEARHGQETKVLRVSLRVSSTEGNVAEIENVVSKGIGSTSSARLTVGIAFRGEGALITVSIRTFRRVTLDFGIPVLSRAISGLCLAGGAGKGLLCATLPLTRPTLPSSVVRETRVTGGSVALLLGGTGISGVR